MIIEDVSLRKITAVLENNEIQKIKDFMQGAVYCWCKNCKDDDLHPKWFAAHDLFGGDNYFWEGTPLFKLYEWHERNGSADPIKMAGRDAGHLLKEILYNDRRNFHTREGFTREYQWAGE